MPAPLRCIVAGAFALFAATTAAGAAEPQSFPPLLIETSASAEVMRVVDWVTGSGDNRGLPFMVVDKADAQVFVFDADARLLGVAPALLGSARGDHSTPGVGDRELSDIAPDERTTPAGRFFAAYGPAAGAKEVLWVDYETAISLHPVVTTNPKERRLQRLRSPTVRDNRITFGCINVSTAFYKTVVRPTFRKSDGVVYVLPETTPLERVFPGLQTQAAMSGATISTP